MLIGSINRKAACTYDFTLLPLTPRRILSVGFGAEICLHHDSEPRDYTKGSLSLLAWESSPTLP